VYQARKLKFKWVTVYHEPSHRWETFYVEDVRIKWRDQVDPIVSYYVQKYNEWKEKVGELTILDLGERRHYEVSRAAAEVP
jgi:hypothetical protein